MPSENGRKLKIDFDTTTLLGVRSKTVTSNKDLVDVTTDDDDGWRRLLSDPGLRSVEVSVSGITSDDTLVEAFYSTEGGEAVLDAALPVAANSTSTISGTFIMSNIEVSGEHDGSFDFSATFMSSGPVTYTPAT